MQQIKQIPPKKLDASARIAEAASLLANGLVRMRDIDTDASKNDPSYTEVQLGFCLEKSVHTTDAIKP